MTMDKHLARTVVDFLKERLDEHGEFKIIRRFEQADGKNMTYRIDLFELDCFDSPERIASVVMPTEDLLEVEVPSYPWSTTLQISLHDPDCFNKLFEAATSKLCLT